MNTTTWGVLTHLICSDLRWKLRASTRMSSLKGGLSFLRRRSKWAELESAWTPLSVRLETVRDTGLRGLSLFIASCRESVKESTKWKDIKHSCTSGNKRSLKRGWGNMCRDRTSTSTWNGNTLSFSYSMCPIVIVHDISAFIMQSDILISGVSLLIYIIIYLTCLDPGRKSIYSLIAGNGDPNK